MTCMIRTSSNGRKSARRSGKLAESNDGQLELKITQVQLSDCSLEVLVELSEIFQKTVELELGSDHHFTINQENGLDHQVGEKGENALTMAQVGRLHQAQLVFF